MSDEVKSYDIMVCRHSLSHVLACAVRRVCPNVKLGIGPPIDEGFYYDFLVPEGSSFTPEILEKIEKEMTQIIKGKHDYIARPISPKEAREIFKDEPFKIQLIDELEEKQNAVVGTYQTENFIDLCNGPHVSNTKDLQKVAWKIDRVSGAYWKGHEKNPMMQRIYVLAFSTKDELKSFIQRREEAAKRDHRKLGPELELFTFSDLIGKGMPILLPKGATIRRLLERLVVDEELKRGYQHVYTPVLGKKTLYEISGHWEHYKDGMYPLMHLSENDEIVLRPMTCPHHFMIYKDTPKSYRDLPLRIAEISPQFRKELSGELCGLTRVMLFTLADAHIFCAPEQLEDEFKRVLELISFLMKRLGIDSLVSYRASLKDDQKKDKYVDNPEMWKTGESILLGILEKLQLPYTKGLGDAAFYGPKLDIQMTNVYGKEETVFTVQIDFALPGRFNLLYIDKDGKEKCPVVVHRSSIGCLERTIAFLVEFYAGAFPLWLSPVQAKVIAITENQIEYAKEIAELLNSKMIRVETDLRSETLNKKIREGRLQRVPYLVVVGEKEKEARSVTVRNRETGEQRTLSLEQFIERISKENADYSLKLEI
ncbi:MAG: threonine--tRNA ligase [Candidatus Brocadiae bacterium]|nr:threonine--tRNA ligase [Candidatus Brocadiia bacterium]